MDDRYETEDSSPEARIAAVLSAGIERIQVPPADSREAELLRVLRLARADYVSTARMPAVDASNRMLAGIRAVMERERGRETVAHRIAKWTRILGHRPAWVVAAALVFLAVALAVLLTPRGDVVAESDAVVVVYSGSDGSVITLRPHSRLIDVGERAYRLEGEAYFDVVRDEDHAFNVAAGDGLIEVLGTRFSIGTWGERVRVFVDEGSVRFSDKESGASLDLVMGESSELVDGRPVPTERIGRAAALDWMNGSLVLDSQLLGDVVSELGQHFDIRIQLPPDLEDERLTGRILLPNADQALLDLGIVVGGEFVRTGPAAYRFERR